MPSFPYSKALLFDKNKQAVTLTLLKIKQVNQQTQRILQYMVGVFC